MIPVREDRNHQQKAKHSMKIRKFENDFVFSFKKLK